MSSTLVVDLEKVSRTANIAIVVFFVAFGVAGTFISFYVLIARRSELPFIGENL